MKKREKFKLLAEEFLELTGRTITYRNGRTTKLPYQVSLPVIQQLLDIMQDECVIYMDVFVDGDPWTGYTLTDNDGQVLDGWDPQRGYLRCYGKTPLKAVQDYVIEHLTEWLEEE